jgi:penicillin-binding protein 2
VLVENAGFGARAAAPVARKVLDFYLLGKGVDKPAAPAPKLLPKATEDDDGED